MPVAGSVSMILNVPALTRAIPNPAKEITPAPEPLVWMLKFGQGVVVPPNGIRLPTGSARSGAVLVPVAPLAELELSSHVDPSMLRGVVQEVRQRRIVGDPVAPSAMPGSTAPPRRVVTVRVEPDTEPENHAPVRLAALKVRGPPTSTFPQNFAAEHQTVCEPAPEPIVWFCVTLPSA